jgi:hypothetical protein
MVLSTTCVSTVSVCEYSQCVCEYSRYQGDAKLFAYRRHGFYVAHDTARVSEGLAPVEVMRIV